ncbi:ribonuclease H-like domain-containing protein [Thelephora terrestris]|uniref:Ribonuclease H-like domain-containing protein n=1 Tax=Thelephora terrestris TaxID=56493 RepID=A0A9P6L294_9AGAM|nr:ribonuclease H-like domain-containing protein [Thelephora terrestris]
MCAITSLKRRGKPQSAGDPTVGTEGDLTNVLQSLQLTVSHLLPYLLSKEEMATRGYVVDIPEGPGGDKPNEEGGVIKCHRCQLPRKVLHVDGAGVCVYHWGRIRPTKKAGGKKVGRYTCCSALPIPGRGCVRGPHVFRESNPADLHKRHAFTYTRPPDSSRPVKTLGVAALDCEMIYTTGGLSVARVSVVGVDGRAVFDEYVKMDEGVHVIDFNTRFSGITPAIYSRFALRPLVEIRRSLDELISSETILVGHSLEHDLKSLRMIHLRNVDTAVVFRRPTGPQYGTALRDLVTEYLGRAIQTGSAKVGHSSLEDSVATFDLLKWHIINQPSPSPAAFIAASASASTSQF